MRYELYYWPSIQGRGEFIRLALEAAGADYVDIARRPRKEGGGEAAIMRLLEDEALAYPAFAQTANILLYLGPCLGLVPEDEASRLWAHQLQLTIADAVVEVHDTHHPIGSGLYYEDQQAEAKRRAADFLAQRLPKFLGYFERVLAQNPYGGQHLVGNALSYVDLSLFQMVAGLRYAFPRAMASASPAYPRIAALHDLVATRPRIAAYLTSSRRLPFNEQGIFRHYPELEASTADCRVALLHHRLGPRHRQSQAARTAGAESGRKRACPGHPPTGRPGRPNGQGIRQRGGL